jgi:hypothetical protein
LAELRRMIEIRRKRNRELAVNRAMTENDFDFLVMIGEMGWSDGLRFYLYGVDPNTAALLRYCLDSKRGMTQAHKILFERDLLRRMERTAKRIEDGTLHTSGIVIPFPIEKIKRG